MPPFLNFAPLENGLAALQRVTRAVRPGAGAGRGEWRVGAGARGAARGEHEADRGGARADAQRGAARIAPGSSTRSTRPGFYTGYGVKTLPAVRESIEQKQWKLAEEQIVKVGKVLENAGEAIQGAAAELDRAIH